MSAHEAQGHAEGSTRLFMIVWVALVVLTLIEVYFGYIHLPVHLMLVLLLGLSLIKAGLIVAYFMHLRFERFSLVLTLVPMWIIVTLLMLAFFPDSFRLLNLRFP